LSIHLKVVKKVKTTFWLPYLLGCMGITTIIIHPKNPRPRESIAI